VVTKTPFPVKAKLWLREFMLKSEEKHSKNQIETTAKKRGH